MAKNRDICIESSIPVVSESGLNTLTVVDFSGAPSVSLPANTVINGVGTLVDTSSVQTLTNKTLANPTTITGAVISGSTIGTSTVNGVTLSSTGSSSLFLTQAGTYASTSAGNLTGVVTSVGTATSFGTFTSATLAAALSDETGTGLSVFASKPTFIGTINTVVSMGAQAINGSLGSIFTRTLAGNETFTQTNISVGQCILVVVTNAAGGGDTVTWFGTITWNTTGGTAPVQAAGANGVTTYGFLCTAANTFLGYLVGTQ